MNIKRQQLLAAAVGLTLGSGLVLTSTDIVPDIAARLYLNIVAIYLAMAAAAAWAIYLSRREAGPSVELAWGVFRRPLALAGALLAAAFAVSSVAYVLTSQVFQYPALIPLGFAAAGVVGCLLLAPSAVALVRTAR